MLVGEAYCTTFMGRRVSVWEAQAQRQADSKQAKEATAESLENRQRIQQEATKGRRAQALETKRLEQQRQLDQQRGDIHPDHVQTTLQALAQQAKPLPSPRPQPVGLLPTVEPEEVSHQSRGTVLPIRKWGNDHD